jgi:hypothetical protein
VKKFSKCLLAMTPLGVKTCEESEFDILKAKKRFPASDKACILKRKVAKIAFCLNAQAFPGSGKRFFALKMSNLDFLHVFTQGCQEHLFKIRKSDFKNQILRAKIRKCYPLYCVVAPQIVRCC